ncbi:MAG: glutaredoxin domain-containing protein [Polyangiaceae bacterium]
MIVGRVTRIAAAIVAGVVLGGSGMACKRAHPAVVSVSDAPPFVVRDDTDGLQLTWIDDKGDFHVELRVADVPMMGRDAVRVVDTNGASPGDGERVWVVDLRQTKPDGAYRVSPMKRADFEAIAVARREKLGPTLAGGPPPEESPSAEPQGAASAPAGASARPVVVVYGAEWCGACHEAERYLRSKGIAFVTKDVDKDPSAAREMQAKLDKAGLHTGSIPVLDVRGKVMVGFNPGAIEAALGDKT